jgi:small-conductance mechanosensitive channel
MDFTRLTEIFDNFGIDTIVRSKLITSLITILVITLIRRAVLKILSTKITQASSLYQWRKTISYIAFFFGFILVGRIWYQGVQALTTILGLSVAGLAIALKDPLVNLAGWAFLVWRRPLEVGDRIQIGNYKGDVIDVRIFQFTLMEIGNWVDADQSTGRVIHIPNGKIFTEMQANYSKGFQYIWDEIPVLVTFESDWENAKKILNEIAIEHGSSASQNAKLRVEKANEKFMIHYTKLTPIVYTEVKDSGIMLTIRYLCAPRGRRGAAQTIWEAILKEFCKHDNIDFAYPTQRLYSNATEGKPGTRPKS